jgi:predicted TIM-barrel fold metal-dependent hydrolase
VIFDSHMHVGDFGPMFNVSLDRDGLAAIVAEHDYEGCCVFHPDNEYVRGVVESIPEAYALAWANPRLPGYLEEAERFIDHPKFLGMKLHPLIDGYHPNDPAVHPLMELLEDRGLPVLLHCGHPIFTLPWSIEELAVNFPDVRVVLGHMGHGNVVYINASIDVAARNPNVYLETSGMPMHTKIKEAVDRIGSDRVLYGSDAPFHHPAVEILRVQVSGLEPDVLDRVLRANGRALFLGEEGVGVKEVSGARPSEKGEYE